jgi:catechol 2,3-dioxygenase-like lactoylglutathione lyase family enzyme
MDWKIELVAIPVTDVDRAKAFYVDQVGFHAEMLPGSQKGVQMVVADAAAAREELIARGVEASEIDVQPWGSFVFFSDPDGNTWSLQQPPPWS